MGSWETDELTIRAAADVLRANGEVRADDFRKGLEDADDEAEAEGCEFSKLVDMTGGSDGSPTDAGRPPGVRARVMEVLSALIPSRDCE